MKDVWILLRDYAGLAGGVLGVVAVGIGFATGWGIPAYVLLAVALLGIGTWLLTHRPQVDRFFGLRSTQSNANILVNVVAVLVILVLVNVIGSRFDGKLDLTSEGLYSLSSQTQQIVKGLAEPIKISVVASDVPGNIRPQLEQYQRLNPERISFEFVDPVRSPATAQALGVTQNNVLVVAAGSRKQTVPAAVDVESQLTPAILKVSRTTELTAYFVEGHGEPSLSGSNGVGILTVNQALAAEGFTAKPLNLVEAGIPADADVITVVGPQRPYLPAEVEKLKTFLDQGGRVLLLLNPQLRRDGSDSQLGLGSLLSEWGIEADNNVIVDLSEAGQVLGTGPSVALVTNYGSHPITQDLVRQNLLTFFPLARSLTKTEVEGITATQLLTTSPRSWGETDPVQDNNSQIRFDQGRDKQGPLSLGYALSRAPREGQPKESRLVVIGNSSFVVDGNFKQFGNGDLVLNSINWLTEQDQQIAVRPKEPTNRRLSLTGQSLIWLTLLAVFALPLAAIGVGVAIWWQRR
ncbi:MAG: Gldg family protein [Synechococcales cyanobacterium]